MMREDAGWGSREANRLSESSGIMDVGIVAGGHAAVKKRGTTDFKREFNHRLHRLAQIIEAKGQTDAYIQYAT